MKTPIVPPNNLGPHLAGKSVNETSYRGMIWSLMYLTATRPDIQFFTVLCARYQSNPKESHLIAVKRIRKYLKGTPTFGLYYPKCSGFDLKGYSNSDYAGCNMDRKSTSVEAEYVAVTGCCAIILWMKNQLSDYDIHYKMNYLREFWSTTVAYDPSPSTDETEQRPLSVFLIKFSVLNGQRPLTLDFNTFCSSTSIDYNNGKYVDHPTPEVVKKELGKIAINPSYLDITPVLKNSFHMAWRILFTFMIQVLGGNYSSTKQVNLIQQLLTYCLITRTDVDIGEIIYNDLVTKLLNKSRLKYVSYPRFISCALQVLLGCDYTQDAKFRYLPNILSNSNFTKDPSKVSNIELTAQMIAVNNQKDSVSPLPFSAKKKKVKSQTVTPTLPKSQGPKASESLLQKRKKPQSKKTPKETKATSHPKPTKDYEQSYSVSSGTVPDPQDLERNIQLASTGLPSILNEGTRKSQLLPESTTLDSKDSVGNKQPIDTGLPSMTSDEGTAKAT
ncbi:hypothetical protein Tco_0420764 [Tanacetum coccineum]